MADIDLTLMKNRISELERQASTDEQPLKSGDGGSTFEGMDDARFDQIDARQRISDDPRRSG